MILNLIIFIIWCALLLILLSDGSKTRSKSLKKQRQGNNGIENPIEIRATLIDSDPNPVSVAPTSFPIVERFSPTYKHTPIDFQPVLESVLEPENEQPILEPIISDEVVKPAFSVDCEVVEPDYDQTECLIGDEIDFIFEPKSKQDLAANYADSICDNVDRHKLPNKETGILYLCCKVHNRVLKVYKTDDSRATIESDFADLLSVCSENKIQLNDLIWFFEFVQDEDLESTFEARKKYFLS